jgi:hypothetical protein
MNLMEQLQINFKIILSSTPQESKRIIGEPQFTYDLAIEHIIKKLKDLGYKELHLAFRPVPYILVEDCKYTPIVAVIKEEEEDLGNPKEWYWVNGKRALVEKL